MNVLRDQNNDSDSHSNSKGRICQQKAALETFSSEIGNMLSSVKDGIGNEFFTSGLDIVLLDLVGENAIGRTKVVLSTTTSCHDLRRVFLKAFMIDCIADG